MLMVSNSFFLLTALVSQASVVSSGRGAAKKTTPESLPLLLRGSSHRAAATTTTVSAARSGSQRRKQQVVEEEDSSSLDDLCGSEWIGYNELCFYDTTIETTSYDECSAICVEQHEFAELPCIADESMNSFFRLRFGNHVWLSMRRSNTSTSWNDDASTMMMEEFHHDMHAPPPKLHHCNSTHLGWAAGQPDNEQGDEFCVEMRDDSLLQGWNDIVCSNVEHPVRCVCQQPLWIVERNRVFDQLEENGEDSYLTEEEEDEEEEEASYDHAMVETMCPGLDPAEGWSASLFAIFRGCTFFSKGAHSYEDCRAACAERGAKLPCTSGSAMDDALTEFFGSVSANLRFWMPLVDAHKNGTFQWDADQCSVADGTYAGGGWAEDQPDNSNGHEHCVEFRALDETLGWNDVDCEESHHVYCLCVAPSQEKEKEDKMIADMMKEHALSQANGGNYTTEEHADVQGLGDMMEQPPPDMMQGQDETMEQPPSDMMQGQDEMMEQSPSDMMQGQDEMMGEDLSNTTMFETPESNDDECTGTGHFTVNGHCFREIDYLKEQDCMIKCLDHQWTLPCFEDEAMDNAFRGIHFNDDTPTWIGLRMESPTEPIWANGKCISQYFGGFAEGEPNNAEYDKCVVVQTNAAVAPVGWNDVDCADIYRCVCQKPVGHSSLPAPGMGHGH